MTSAEGGRIATLATCNLGQWAMDFRGNKARIAESVARARRAGARYRLGPELEVPGYGCEDHFLESDTVEHSWEIVSELVSDGCSDGLLLDLGLPVLHAGVRYNCRVFILDRRILLVRPKRYLANDGNYREPRYFASWRRPGTLEELRLPPCISAVLTGPPGAAGCGALAPAAAQRTAPIGDACLRLRDATIAAETCEELFTPASPHIAYALGGVEIITNGSGSHHSLRKLGQRLDLMRSATAKCGGVYLYANQQGCDGGRLYYDGCASVFMNGLVLAQGSQFSVREVEVVTATVDLDAVDSFRGSIASLQDQAADAGPMPGIEVDFFLCSTEASPSPPVLGAAPPPTEAGAAFGVDIEETLAAVEGLAVGGELVEPPVAGGRPLATSSPRPRRAPPHPTLPIEADVLPPEAEIARGPACWLWDYLRRSGAGGYVLPLSGGADSAATCAIVASMCRMACEAAAAGDEGTARDVRRLARLAPGDPIPAPKELCGRIFLTAYLGTSNSSAETRERARAVAEEAGARHLSLDIDPLVAALVSFFALVFGRAPRYRSRGGSGPENLALQNIQARVRMVATFLLAQLSPWASGWSGFLLVLGSSNVDETLRGYLTKYDCSAADVNPIGGVSKGDLKKFLAYASRELEMPSLLRVVEATPTAELEPLGEDGAVAQTDEADMGMTYAELGEYGRLRKVARLGPVAMFRALNASWGAAAGLGLAASEVARKVKHFFVTYSINRHKTTVLPPSYHAETYSPDDNRFDHRQFLYNTRWEHQFAKIDALVAEAERGD